MVSTVAVDSNALTYLIEAIEPGYDPIHDDSGLAPERVAMIRGYLYCELQYWVVPTVEAEYNRIRQPDRHLRHHNAAGVLLYAPDLSELAEAVARRSDALASNHPRPRDCRIVAEAELAGVSVLLTRDDDLIKNLDSYTQVSLIYPSKYLEGANLRPGAEPRLAPHPTNPLSRVHWWRL